VKEFVVIFILFDHKRDINFVQVQGLPTLKGKKYEQYRLAGACYKYGMQTKQKSPGYGGRGFLFCLQSFYLGSFPSACFDFL